MLNCPLERGRRSERGIDRFPVPVNHRWKSVPTVDNKTGKTYGPSAGTLVGRRRCEMKRLKNSSHADMMPRVEIKFNISVQVCVQVIVHKLVYGFVLILWLIVSAWPS